MNYRHIFHAGAFSDVFKHSILLVLLEALMRKDTPITYIDTHSGIGFYDLTSKEARRSPEFEAGVAVLLERHDVPEVMHRYLNHVRTLNPAQKLTCYPGSPWFAAHTLRDIDEMALNELHPDDFDTLKSSLRRPNGRIHFHNRDASEFLPAMVPPPSRRALVLIDPAYEKKDEYQQLKLLLKKSCEKFPSGVYALWYPITQGDHKRYIKPIINACARDALQVEIVLCDRVTNETGLLGCGFLIINPPYQTEYAIADIAEYLSHVLRIDNSARFHIQHFSSGNKS